MSCFKKLFTKRSPTPPITISTDHRGRTHLHHAAISGNCDDIRQLLLRGYDVNADDRTGSTPLCCALDNDQCEAAVVLVEAGAHVDFINHRGKTALELLLAISNIYVNTESLSNLFTLLTAAGATVDGATVEISPLVPSDVIRAIVPDDTPFWLAANNDAPMLAAELAGGLDPNMKTENGMTLLHWACAGDAPECVQLLLDAGADKEAGDPTPIFYCMHESSECLKHLINAEINVNQIEEARLPLHFALAANSPACVTALVGAGAWVTQEEISTRPYFSPIQSVLRNRPVQVDLLNLLLKLVSRRVLNGKIDAMPPLYWAVEYSTVDGVRVLVEAGANVNEDYLKTGQNIDTRLFISVLEYAAFCKYRPEYASDRRILTTIEYLKTLPAFSGEEKA